MQSLKQSEYGTLWSGACGYTNARGGGRSQVWFCSNLRCVMICTAAARAHDVRICESTPVIARSPCGSARALDDDSIELF